MRRLSIILSTAIVGSVIIFPYSTEAGLTDILKGAEKATEFFKKDVHGKLRKGFEDLTLEEEYYIGRAVSATILGQYEVYADSKRNKYLNTLGQYLVWSSSRPVVFDGFHFTLIESDEINAFAAPGGFIFVTTGLYRRIENEEQLAAVLAHEIAHVNLQHGLRSIKKSNLTQAFTILGNEAASRSDQQEWRQLSGAFGDSIDDIVEQMVVSGYSKSYEYDADEEALRIVFKAGYNPDGLEEFLELLDKGDQGDDEQGFYGTHPKTGKRIDKIDKLRGKRPMTADTEEVRTERFRNLELTTAAQT